MTKEFDCGLDLLTVYRNLLETEVLQQFRPALCGVGQAGRGNAARVLRRRFARVIMKREPMIWAFI